MKKVNAISVIILFVMAGCGGQRQSGDDDFITVDVTKTNYPKKELILQDFMDVEYIVLETKNDFINQGFVQDIGKEIILVRNYNDDGDIFIYDRYGKALRKVNRKGQGSEEYLNILGITLDEDNNEMFVNDHYTRRILVYDLYGKFKRSFKQKERGESFYVNIFNYNNDNLICYDAYDEEIAFVLISKQDGSITKEIKIPFTEKKLLEQQLIDEENIFTVGPGPYRTIIPYYNGNWILSENSSDTIYTFLPDYSLRPFIVRTPPIQSMDPEIFLNLRLLSDRYYFMETIKNVYDFNTNNGFPRTFMVYDKQEEALFNYTVYNDDFSPPKEIYMSMTKPVNHEIDSWYPLEAYQLVWAYRNGDLKDKLKEIAAGLKEDDNPVIMLIKHKK